MKQFAITFGNPRKNIGLGLSLGVAGHKNAGGENKSTEKRAKVVQLFKMFVSIVVF